MQVKTQFLDILPKKPQFFMDGGYECEVNPPFKMFVDWVHEPCQLLTSSLNRENAIKEQLKAKGLNPDDWKWNPYYS